MNFRNKCPKENKTSNEGWKERNPEKRLHLNQI